MAPRIVGDRRLPCHGHRAARLVVSSEAVVRTCPICLARYTISFVEDPRLSVRLGISAYSLAVTPYVDGRARRRLERVAVQYEANPRLPFDEY